MITNGKYKIALITGATGFVGSNLVKRLVTDKWEVHIIVRPDSDLSLIKNPFKEINIHKHNETTKSMFTIVKKSKPDVVFHLASFFRVEHCAEDIEPLIKSNVILGVQLVEAMVSNGVYRLINIATSWQHFRNKNYNPVCLYAATKQAFEDILKFYLETTPLKAITLKLFDTYGYGDPRKKLFSLLRNSVKENIVLAMSPGEQLIDIVYIDDVIEAFVIAVERLYSDNLGKKYESYAVSSGKPLKLKELVKKYEIILGRKIPVEWGKKPYRNREVMVPWNKGKHLSGWHPKVDIEKGLRLIIKE